MNRQDRKKHWSSKFSNRFSYNIFIFFVFKKYCCSRIDSVNLISYPESPKISESFGQSSSIPIPEQAPKVSNIEKVIPAVVLQNSITLPGQTKNEEERLIHKHISQWLSQILKITGSLGTMKNWLKWSKKWWTEAFQPRVQKPSSKR